MLGKKERVEVAARAAGYPAAEHHGSTEPGHLGIEGVPKMALA